MDERPTSARRLLLGIRYGLPAALLVAGVALLLLADASSRWDGFALCVGAGLSILLMNVLFRIGASGDRERRQEDAAREYYAEHGHWPDEAPPGRER